MRPRINKKFNTVKWEDLNDYFYDNYVFSCGAEVLERDIIYSRKLLFRSNKKDPEKIFIKVSRNSKFVIEAWDEHGQKFNSIDELKQYTKK